MMWMTLAIPTKYYVKKTTVIGRITDNVLFSRRLLLFSYRCDCIGLQGRRARAHSARGRGLVNHNSTKHESVNENY